MTGSSDTAMFYSPVTSAGDNQPYWGNRSCDLPSSALLLAPGISDSLLESGICDSLLEAGICDSLLDAGISYSLLEAGLIESC